MGHLLLTAKSKVLVSFIYSPESVAPLGGSRGAALETLADLPLAEALSIRKVAGGDGRHSLSRHDSGMVSVFLTNNNPFFIFSCLSWSEQGSHSKATDTRFESNESRTVADGLL